MRARLPLLAAVPVLLGPAALAFFKGGYFDGPRLWAAAVAWLLAGTVLLAAPRPLPVARPGRLALAGLAALVAWTGLSILWAPVAGAAVDSAQRGLLYLGGLVAAVPALRDPRVRRACEPVVLGGILVAAAYGLSERLLPGIVSLEQIASAGDRLNQPLTYWNAMGALCGIGVVLAAGLVADASRPRAMRAAASAAAPPLVLALYLSLSRGALGATIGGLAVLVAVAPAPRTAAAAVVVLLAGAIPVLATVALGDVEHPHGSAGQGAAMIGVLAIAMALAAAGERLTERRPAARAPMLRTAAVALLAATVIASGFAAVKGESRSGELPRGATAQRLVSVQNNRLAYWKVAARTWADHPIDGIGAGGFAVAWLRERTISETVRDAHSLYIETAAELGIVGVAALVALLIGGAGSARLALRRAGPAAAGATAGLATWTLHAALDWDWEMPALTLVAVVLLARLIAADQPANR
ncbi:MAG: hypothetical protein QOK21_1275 [Solirubrobacteraceae bacterium]|nr:hypothetical protein [Solirubrobacteraceae bacterium]